VANEFVKRYYDVLANHPRYLPKFYKEESTFSLNGDTVKTQTVRAAPRPRCRARPRTAQHLLTAPPPRCS
jgi:hypothetical protein